MTVTLVVTPEPATPDKGAVSTAPASPLTPAPRSRRAHLRPGRPHGPKPDPLPMAITVDADGIVTSINGVAYCAARPHLS